MTPPRLEIPAVGREACPLYTLPENPTRGDLERGYATRGAQVVECEGRRRLNADVHDAEHELEDLWLEMQRQLASRRWYKPWTW